MEFVDGFELLYWIPPSFSPFPLTVGGYDFMHFAFGPVFRLRFGDSYKTIFGIIVSSNNNSKAFYF